MEEREGGKERRKGMGAVREAYMASVYGVLGKSVKWLGSRWRVSELPGNLSISPSSEPGKEDAEVWREKEHARRTLPRQNSVSSSCSLHFKFSLVLLLIVSGDCFLGTCLYKPTVFFQQLPLGQRPHLECCSWISVPRCLCEKLFFLCGRQRCWKPGRVSRCPRSPLWASGRAGIQRSGL